jgi:uncharacterized protein
MASPRLELSSRADHWTAAKKRTVICAALYLVAWTGSSAFLARLPGGSMVEQLLVLGTFGVVFPAIALIVTRGDRPTVAGAERGRLELAAALLYLAAFSILVLGWGFSFLREHVPPGRARDLVRLAVKLLTMCAGPVLLFRMLGSRAVPAGALRLRRTGILPGVVLGVALLAFQAVFGRGLRTLSELHPSTPTLLWGVTAALVWLAVEAGLTEEVIFRAVVQTRFAAVLSSEAGAVFVAAAVFGLAHAPGLYLRGGHLAEGLAGVPTWSWAVAYSIATVSPAGLFFGVLWWRTRSLLLVVFLHGWMDLLPNLAEFIRTWSR